VDIQLCLLITAGHAFTFVVNHAVVKSH